MIIEKFRKHPRFTVYGLLFTILFFPVYAGAGWLLWEAPAYIAAPSGEKELRSADTALDSVPRKAFLEGKPDTGLELDAVFEAGTDDLRIFFGEAGFEETPYELKKAFFGALTQLFSAHAPSKFPPAPKWLAPPFVPESGKRGTKQGSSDKSPGNRSAEPAGGRPQDLSFIRLRKGGRQGVYLWRLPFRTKKAPLWAAGLSSPGGERGWALFPEKAEKSRALEIRARRTGKTYFIFTLP